ncbi:MAG: PIN domain-containing protein [Chloroflexi bacterium]|nr:PIN domain-containing protein [Chloroflexota bacterium]
MISESAALIQARYGLEHALTFLAEVKRFTIHWITETDHDDAVRLLRRRERRRLSLVDCASFVVMKRYGVTEALAFDEDFEREGFRTL